MMRCTRGMIGQRWEVLFWDHTQDEDKPARQRAIGVVYGFDKSTLVLLAWWPEDGEPSLEDNSACQFNILRSTIIEMTGPLGVVTIHGRRWLAGKT